MKGYTLGFSPCPNDTFIFYGIVHKRIDCGGLDFKEYIEDVETLNRWACEGRLDVTKVSAAAYGHISSSYEMLGSGGAAGWGCGPLLVSKEKLNGLGGKTLAIPGVLTTAYLLAGLYDARLRENIIEMPFDRIIPAVADGDVDCGLVIHEGRFTYKDYGLRLVADLGRWWEEETGLPVPLGLIAAKRSIPADVRKRIDEAIRASLSFAWACGTAEVMDYVRRHSSELSDDVIKSHINLYVNDYSGDCGGVGTKAIEKLLDMARKREILRVGV